MAGGVFDRAATNYATAGPDFFSHFGRALVERTGVGAGDQILDVACGAGAALIPAAQRVRSLRIAVGVDLSEAMLRRAQEACAGLELVRVGIARMDAHYLGFRQASFDVVLCGFALGSFVQPLRVLEECCRATRQGGRLGLSVADRWWWDQDERWDWHAELLYSLGVHVEPGRFSTEQAVADAVERSGWRLVAIDSEPFPLLFSSAQEWWAWAWSHGYREILENMGASDLEHYRRECFAHFDRARGPVPGQLEVIVALAEKSKG